MAISDNTKRRYQQYNNSYVESDEERKKREQARQVINSQPAQYENGYIQKMNELYDKIANSKSFEYDKASDKAYQQYAKMYQQLGDLSMNATAQTAGDLTGGYGSTYSDAVANQTNEAYQSKVDEALPAFYQMAQNEYNAKEQNELSNYQSAIQGYQNVENSNYYNQNAWNSFAGASASRYNQEHANKINEYLNDKKFWQDQYWNEQNAENTAKELESERYWNENQLAENQRQFDNSLDSERKQSENELAYKKWNSETSLAEDQRQFNDELGYDSWNTETSLAEDQRQFDAELGYDKWKNKTSLAEDKRQFDANLKENKKENERDEKWKANEINLSLAADKCDSFKDKKDNKGMKSYLNKQVKNGNITKYQADALYKQYKYTATKSSGGGSGGRRSSGSSGSGYSRTSSNTTGNSRIEGSSPDNMTDKTKSEQENLNISDGMLQGIGMNRTDEGRTNAIESMLNKKTINEAQANWLLKHFKLK